MVIALLAAWVVGGLLLALLVGAAVRTADQRRPPTDTTHRAVTPVPVGAGTAGPR